MHNEVYNEAHARHATHEQIGASESNFQLAFIFAKKNAISTMKCLKHLIKLQISF